MLGYLTKAEAGLSKLLKAIEDESGKCANVSMDQKMKEFARALDNSREVSMQEIVFRLNGHYMCVSSRIVKPLNLKKPEERDGLLKGNLNELEQDENPFFNSLIDYYSQRPDELEHLCFAEFAADYDLLSRSGQVNAIDEDEPKDPNIDKVEGKHLFSKLVFVNLSIYLMFKDLA